MFRVLLTHPQERFKAAFRVSWVLRQLQETAILVQPTDLTYLLTYLLTYSTQHSPS
jgi:predicted dienelactone hydrolase